MLSVAVLGYAAAALSCFMVLPQAVVTFRQRHDLHALAGVSLASMLGIAVNSSMWVVWAIAAKAYPAGIPALVNGPAAVFIAFLILRARRRTRSGGGPG